MLVNNSSIISTTAYHGFNIYSIQTSSAAWVTVYNTSTAATADTGRSISIDPVPGSGVIAEAITTGAQTVNFTPCVGGYLNNSPPNTTLSMKVVNTGNSAAAITVTLTVLQTEV
jgi:hypothetical protein